MAFSVKIQSPDFDGVGNGSEVSIPASVDVLDGTSFAEIITFMGGDNSLLDFLQLREVISLTGFLTDEAGASAVYRATGLADPRPIRNAVHFRDIIRGIRAGYGSFGSWIGEDGTAAENADGTASTTWGSTGLPVSEQDAATARSSNLRLIYDKTWRIAAASGSLQAGSDADTAVVTGDVSHVASGILRNTSRSAEAAVSSATYSSGTGRTTLELQSSISGQTSGDGFALDGLTNMFAYGTVGSVRFGPRGAASLRGRIPFSITFLVGTVEAGE